MEESVSTVAYVASLGERMPTIVEETVSTVAYVACLGEKTPNKEN